MLNIFNSVNKNEKALVKEIEMLAKEVAGIANYRYKNPLLFSHDDYKSIAYVSIIEIVNNLSAKDNNSSPLEIIKSHRSKIKNLALYRVIDHIRENTLVKNRLHLRVLNCYNVGYPLHEISAKFQISLEDVNDILSRYAAHHYVVEGVNDEYEMEDSHEHRSSIKEIISKTTLTTTERNILNMILLNKMSKEDICKSLKLQPDSFNVNYSRASKKIKEKAKLLGFNKEKDLKCA